jgi:hypothetical protein
VPPPSLVQLELRHHLILVGCPLLFRVRTAHLEECVVVGRHARRLFDVRGHEGIQINGAPKTVFLRGRAVIEGGKFVGRPGAGQFLRRQTHSAIK